MNIVLDTNVIISGLLWLGAPNRILQLIEKGEIKLCLTPQILKEVQEVLKRPKFLLRIKICRTSTEELIADISKIAKLFSDIKIPPVVKEDPDDDQILSCALVANAQFIITGDAHLLKLKKFAGIPIITPHKFLKLLSHLETKTI